MDFSFFMIDNKSGYKTKEIWLSKNFPNLHKEITDYCRDVEVEFSSFKEKIWFYYNNLKERPKCITCGSDVKFRDRLDKPYGEFCSLDCFNKNKSEMIQRQKNTFNKKYGVDFYPQHRDFIKKQRLTKIEKYGDANYNNIEKVKQTKKIKYGNENYNNIDKYKLTCLTKYDSTNYSKSNSFKNKIENNFRNLYPTLKIVSVQKRDVDILCDKCHSTYNIHKQLLYERYNRNYETCVICNPIGNGSRSGYEKEISEFLYSLKIEHSTSDRTIITKELDILIPSKNLAIEVNGLYWHNELFLSDDYHIKKTIECNNKNISLIHIFEDEWNYKKDIVKSILKNKLKLIDKKIYARNCDVREVETRMSKNFLDENHIQGNVNSKVKLGLFYHDDLVSIMTFSKGRIIMGGNKDEWELTRFCNLKETIVVGAASKLFQHFIKNYQYNKIISYSDIRIFNGEMYKSLGFEYVSQSKPNYWYVKNGVRHYRFNFRKNVLVKEGYDKSKTEREIMFERKYYRIYDCGNIRWEYTLQVIGQDV